MAETIGALIVELGLENAKQTLRRA